METTSALSPAAVKACHKNAADKNDIGRIKLSVKHPRYAGTQ